jgi:hypothetical protein
MRAVFRLSRATFSDATEPCLFWYGCQNLDKSIGYRASERRAGLIKHRSGEVCRVRTIRFGTAAAKMVGPEEVDSRSIEVRGRGVGERGDQKEQAAKKPGQVAQGAARCRRCSRKPVPAISLTCLLNLLVLRLTG